jgi:5-formyltetrahydrofolate cyclo-ligase
MLALRGAIPPEERTRMSARIAARALALPELEAEATVVTYASMGSEVQTGRLIGRLAASGIRVALPVVEDAGMHAVRWRPGDPVRRARYGADEPATGIRVEPAEVDVVLAPGLAFDPAGDRLGYGGGYFDRFLAAMRPGALRAALAFERQVIELVPHDDHDQPVDLLVTESRSERCR